MLSPSSPRGPISRPQRACSASPPRRPAPPPPSPSCLRRSRMIPYTASSSLSTARWNCRFSGVGNHGGNTPSEAEPAMYAMASSMLVFTRSAAGPAPPGAPPLPEHLLRQAPHRLGVGRHRGPAEGGVGQLALASPLGPVADEQAVAGELGAGEEGRAGLHELILAAEQHLAGGRGARHQHHGLPRGPEAH